MAHSDYFNELIDNAATLGAVTTKTFTVPAGYRWMVMGGTLERDAAATLTIAFYNSADKFIMGFATTTSSTGDVVSWGVSASSLALTLYQPLPLAAGSYVKYTWSNVQTHPTVTCYVKQIPI